MSTRASANGAHEVRVSVERCGQHEAAAEIEHAVAGAFLAQPVDAVRQ